MNLSEVAPLLIMRLPVLLLALALLSACASPTRVETPPIERGNVRAWTTADAEQLASLVAELDPRVRELLDSEREPPPVWMSNLETIHGSMAATLSTRGGSSERRLIVLGKAAKPFLRQAVGHELAHWHSFNEKEFPQIVEEGIATYVEVVLGLSTVEIDRIDPTANWRRALSLDSTEWDSIPGEENEALYLAGYWLVCEIGLDRLRALHSRGETSPADIALAAGLPPIE